MYMGILSLDREIYMKQLVNLNVSFSDTMSERSLIVRRCYTMKKQCQIVSSLLRFLSRPKFSATKVESSAASSLVTIKFEG